MSQLILIRHGESEWNRDNRFTGWADVGLTEVGRQHMVDAGALIKRAGYTVDVAFTSMLSRCILSQWALLEGMGRVWVPTVLDWRLNERHYGALTGLSKEKAVSTFGAAAVQEWRRSFDVAPPQGIGDGDGHAIVDERYAHLQPDEIPQGEALSQVVDRVRPFWEQVMSGALRAGQCVVVTAHGNSLRALIKLIEDIPDRDISCLEVPNAVPTIYEFDKNLRFARKVSVGTAFTPRSEIL